ncbi:MAG: 1-deoxy-D-xylulose-5-phosphate reductoisomerase, partial [Planctomycetota bacterium]|nr:1-deoxy-D-xylulose-5-phosphate reductoisomerase [Planctomycetota bacterium]
MSKRTEKVFVFGATGSIGGAALDVCRRSSVDVVGIGTKSSLDSLESIVKNFNVRVIHIADKNISLVNKMSLPSGVKVFWGEETSRDAIITSGADTVLNGVSGSAGLSYSIAAVESGVAKLALANKETLVMAGNLFLEIASSKGTKVVPVDSEHNALFRLLGNVDRRLIRRLILTASGGPFFEEKPLEPTPAEALAHPLWQMGKRISIDSATMMNKVFEVVEAHYLFGFTYTEIDILIHPEGLL